MKPLLYIFGIVLAIFAAGWTWSELPRPQGIFIPAWTRSYEVYKQPHAIWLDRYDKPGTNLPALRKLLEAAAKAKQMPEVVVYAIPLRDLGQSSEGGFANFTDYLKDNQLNAEMIGRFVKATKISPRVYLEPDSIPLAVTYRREHNFDAESSAIYNERMDAFNKMIDFYQQAGAKVYLEAGHSAWFDYGDEDLQRISNALNEAGVGRADGVASNVSNRQPVFVSFDGTERTEMHYLTRLIPYLDNGKKLDVVVDTSRDGGLTKARIYYLSPDGQMIDNELPGGRVVGSWKKTETGDIALVGFHGKVKSLKRLTAKEKYSWNPAKRELTAPAWLDAVGDVKLGPAPTDTPPGAVGRVIKRYRYIKPPDDCDGAINCPPGASKTDINTDTLRRQPAQKPRLSGAFR